MKVRRTSNYPHGVKVDACAHMECERPRHAVQLCEAHYRRLERGQNIATVIGRNEAPPAYICQRSGCPQPEFLDGLCGRHWRRARIEEKAA